jgi:hypothetical protein
MLIAVGLVCTQAAHLQVKAGPDCGAYGNAQYCTTLRLRVLLSSQQSNPCAAGHTYGHAKGWPLILHCCIASK